MNIFTIILIKFIKGYKFLISPLLGQSCRYLPTCSEYSMEALKEFGLAKGSLAGLKGKEIISGRLRFATLLFSIACIRTSMS